MVQMQLPHSKKKDGGDQQQLNVASPTSLAAEVTSYSEKKFGEFSVVLPGALFTANGINGNNKDMPKRPIHNKFTDVDWDSLVRGGFLHREDIDMLRTADEQHMDYITRSGSSSGGGGGGGGRSNGQKYVHCLLQVLRTVTSDVAAQYFACSRVEDVLAEEPSRTAKLFLEADDIGIGDDKCSTLDVKPFMRAISSGDVHVQQSASASLALLCVHANGDIEPLVNWICEQLSSGRGSSPSVRIAVQSLSILLKMDRARRLFAVHGGVGYVNKLLRMQGSDLSAAQLLYELCFCLWCIALCEETRPDFLTCGAVPTLVEQVSAAPREKVVRVALSTLRLLAAPPGRGGGGGGGVAVNKFNGEMIHCGLPNTLKNFKSRQWADADIADDVEVLYNVLQANYRDLTTFEIYSQEVMSGQLKWGVVHTEKFWREHVRETEPNDFDILKKVIELLKSEDEEVVAIACYDIGEFVRFYPNGRSIARHLGAKEMVMGLIEHNNQDVRRQALLCTSKIMINKWEFLRA